VCLLIDHLQETQQSVTALLEWRSPKFTFVVLCVIVCTLLYFDWDYWPVLPVIALTLHLLHRLLLRLTGLYHWSWACNPSQKPVKVSQRL
jgi:hypothetical protein